MVPKLFARPRQQEPKPDDGVDVLLLEVVDLVCQPAAEAKVGHGLCLGRII